MLKTRKMQGNRIRNIKSILAVFTFSFPPFLLAGAGLVSLSLSVTTISSRIVFVDWKTEVISWRELFLKIRKYKKNETPCPTTQLYPNINKLQGMWHQLNNIGNPLVAMRNDKEKELRELLFVTENEGRKDRTLNKWTVVVFENPKMRWYSNFIFVVL